MIKLVDIKYGADWCRKAGNSAAKDCLYICIRLFSCCFCCGRYNDWNHGPVGRLRSSYAHRCGYCFGDVRSCGDCYRNGDYKRPCTPAALPTRRPRKLSAIYSNEITSEASASTAGGAQLGLFSRLPFEIRREIFRSVVGDKDLHLVRSKPECITHLVCIHYKWGLSCSASGCGMWPWAKECALDGPSADLLPLLLCSRAMLVISIAIWNEKVLTCRVATSKPLSSSTHPILSTSATSPLSTSFRPPSFPAASMPSAICTLTLAMGMIYSSFHLSVDGMPGPKLVGSSVQ